jgi:hypothetical protein
MHTATYGWSACCPASLKDGGDAWKNTLKA